MLTSISHHKLGKECFYFDKRVWIKWFKNWLTSPVDLGGWFKVFVKGQTNALSD